MTTRRAVYSRFKRHDSRLYRSGLEETTASELKSQGIDPHYEEYYLEYSVPATVHKYTPDFVLPNGVIIETKGIWDVDDRKKHLLIKEQYPELDIRFVFNRSKTPLYKGSKSTYATFCDKNQIKYADKTIPEEWLRESMKINVNNYLKQKKKGS